jgi:hypothetical protein
MIRGTFVSVSSGLTEQTYRTPLPIVRHFFTGPGACVTRICDIRDSGCGVECEGTEITELVITKIWNIRGMRAHIWYMARSMEKMVAEYVNTGF